MPGIIRWSVIEKTFLLNQNHKIFLNQSDSYEKARRVANEHELCVIIKHNGCHVEIYAIAYRGKIYQADIHQTMVYEDGDRLETPIISEENRLKTYPDFEPQDKNVFTYEYGCRRCNYLTPRYYKFTAGNDILEQWFDFVLKLRQMINDDLRLEYCPQCTYWTIQDLVSYTSKGEAVQMARKPINSINPTCGFPTFGAPDCGK